MGELVEGYAAFQLLFADVAPRAHGVRGDGDVEVCHLAQVGGQNEGGVEDVKAAEAAVGSLMYYSE